MAEDYLDAHSRHLEDAQKLYNIGRLANSSHLFGISAECGMKFLINVFENNPLGHIISHIDKNSFQPRYNSSRSGYLVRSNLAQDFDIDLSIYFRDWKVEDRYDNQNDPKFDISNVDRHRDGAEKVRDLINEAKIIGVV